MGLGRRDGEEPLYLMLLILSFVSLYYVCIHLVLCCLCTQVAFYFLLLAPWGRPGNLTAGSWSMASITNGGAAGDRVVRIISLNSGGLNAAIKRTKVMTHVNNLNADIMLLQETHLCKSDHRKLN